MRPEPLPLPRQLVRAAAVVVFSSLVAWGLESRLNSANIILVYMAGVVYVATTCSRKVSLVAIALSIGVFDFVFVPPRWGFNPTHAQDVVTLAFMVAVGLLVTELSTRLRHQAREADLRAERLQALNALSTALATAADAESVHRLACSCLESTLGVSVRMAGPQEDATGMPVVSGDRRYGTLQLPTGAEPDGATADFVAAVISQTALACARLESESQRAAAAVQAEGERLRNTLLSGLSHDFRTPLTTIVGATTSLLEQDDALQPAAKRRLLDSVLQEAMRMHAMTSNMLDLTRMEEGALQPRFEWCPADELVQEVLRTLTPALAPVHVITRVDPDPPVWCDPYLVERVIANLLENAARHTPPHGRIEITGHRVADRWELRVSDTGPGIPAADLEKVFRKFVRASSDGSGTGLGLALCAAIARLHGGTIDARNEGGTVVTLRLPQPEALPALDE